MTRALTWPSISDRTDHADGHDDSVHHYLLIVDTPRRFLLVRHADVIARFAKGEHMFFIDLSLMPDGQTQCKLRRCQRWKALPRQADWMDEWMKKVPRASELV